MEVKSILTTFNLVYISQIMKSDFGSTSTHNRDKQVIILWYLIHPHKKDKTTMKLSFCIYTSSAVESLSFWLVSLLYNVISDSISQTVYEPKFLILQNCAVFTWKIMIRSVLNFAYVCDMCETVDWLDRQNQNQLYKMNFHKISLMSS